MSLRKELSKYNEINCPDNYYLAWKVLFTNYNPPDKDGILKQAKFDLSEEEWMRKQHVFDSNRPRMEDIVKKKFNWSSK